MKGWAERQPPARLSTHAELTRLTYRRIRSAYVTLALSTSLTALGRFCVRRTALLFFLSLRLRLSVPVSFLLGKMPQDERFEEEKYNVRTAVHNSKLLREGPAEDLSIVCRFGACATRQRRKTRDHHVERWRKS